MGLIICVFVVLGEGGDFIGSRPEETFWPLLLCPSFFFCVCFLLFLFFPFSVRVCRSFSPYQSCDETGGQSCGRTIMRPTSNSNMNKLPLHLPSEVWHQPRRAPKVATDRHS